MDLLEFVTELHFSYYFELKKYDSIYNRIRYLKIVKSGITYIISHNYAKIKVHLYDYLSLEKNDFS